MNPHIPAPGDVHPSDDDLLDLAHELLDPGATRTLLDHVRVCAPCEARFRATASDREFWHANPPAAVAAAAAAAADAHTRRPDAVAHTGLPAGPQARLARAREPQRGLASLHSFPRWATPVAAAAALALVVLAPSLRPGMPRRADPRWLPVSHEHTLLRTPALETAGVGLDRALGVYRSGDAAAALRELEALVIPPEAAFESSLRQLYLASAQVLNARPNDALQTLDTLDIPTLPEPWRRWARWTRYLAARDAHHEQEARALLADLVSNPNEVGDQARAEQARLNAR